MDYEKAYKEALAMARDIHDGNPSSGTAITVCEQIFPELIESEDEKIRKSLLDFCKTAATRQTSILVNSIDFDKCVAWLKKQGEQKPINEKAVFEVGETITDGTSTFTIADIVDGHYIADDGDKVCFYVAHKYYTLIKEQKPVENSGKPSENVIKEKDMTEYNKGFECGKQRVLKYPEDFGLCKNSEWSEEDKQIIKNMQNDYHNRLGAGIIPQKYHDKIISWLKSLRPQKHWKPSEEQMYILNWVANILLNHDGVVEEEASKKLQSLYNDLKKLKGL